MPANGVALWDGTTWSRWATGSTATEFELLLPNLPTAVVLTSHQQLGVLEVDPQGAWVAITATHRLTMTVGSF